MPEKVLIITCSLTAQTRVEWALHYRCQTYPFGRVFAANVILATKPESAARNLALHEAEKREASYALFYDDDVLPVRDDAIAHLVTSMDLVPQATVISGVVPMRNKEFPEPVVIKEFGQGPWWGWEDKHLHRVHHAGISFALIRMEDLNDVLVPRVEVEGQEVREFFQVYDDPGHYEGSDEFYFADLLARNGKEWYVHGNVVCQQIDMDGHRYKVEDVKDRVVVAP